MSALLRSWGLVFNVNTSSSILDEEFGQLHDCGQTTVTSIGVRNDGSEKIGVRNAAPARFRSGYAFFTLFPVVEELSQEKLVHFIWNGVLCTLLIGSLGCTYSDYVP